LEEDEELEDLLNASQYIFVEEHKKAEEYSVSSLITTHRSDKANLGRQPLGELS
jgi:hypothetical protein